MTKVNMDDLSSISLMDSAAMADPGGVPGKAKRLAPIVLVPGVCGSQLVFDDGKVRDIAWVNEELTPFPKVSQRMMQYLSGELNASDEFVSYVTKYRYGTIHATPGFDGCNRILHHPILELAPFRSLRLGIYFEPFVEYMVSRHGYMLDETLFAFTYDWRHSLAFEGLLRDFASFLRKVAHKCGRLPVVVSHSLGSLLVMTYMRLMPDWGSTIGKLVSLSGPFNGSGYSINSVVQGYDLRLPIKRSVVRALQAKSGSTPFLVFNNSKGAAYQSVVTSSILVVNRAGPLQPRETYAAPPAATVVIDPNSLSGKRPNMAELLVLELTMVRRPAIHNFHQAMSLLAPLCRPGLIISPVKYRRDCHNLLQNLRAQLKPVQTFHKKTIVLRPDHILDEKRPFPEAHEHRYSSEDPIYVLHYSPAVDGFSPDGRSAAEKVASVAAKIDWGLANVSKTLFELRNASSVLSHKENPNLMACVDILTLIDESKGIAYYETRMAERKRTKFTCKWWCIPPGRIKLTRSPVQYTLEMLRMCQTIRQYNINVTNNYTKACAVDGLVESVQVRRQTKNEFLALAAKDMRTGRSVEMTKSYFTLAQNAVVRDTFDYMLYGINAEQWQRVRRQMDTEIDFSGCEHFQFLSVTGYGVSTPLHTVYTGNPRYYDELATLNEERIFCSGDGTIPASSGMLDPIPEKYVYDRVFIPGARHFTIISCVEFIKVFEKFIDLA